MNLRELWELCGNCCGNCKNPVISRVERIYKREFPQFPHNIYIYSHTTLTLVLNIG